jgi:hypothetical protein
MRFLDYERYHWFTAMFKNGIRFRCRLGRLESIMQEYGLSDDDLVAVNSTKYGMYGQ